MNKQIKPVYVSRADTLMHLHTHTHTHAHAHNTTHTHTSYQLAVGVNCAGPQGKNNIAPKTDSQSVFFLQSTSFYEHKMTQSRNNLKTHGISSINAILIR